MVYIPSYSAYVTVSKKWGESWKEHIIAHPLQLQFRYEYEKGVSNGY